MTIDEIMELYTMYFNQTHVLGKLFSKNTNCLPAIFINISDKGVATLFQTTYSFLIYFYPFLKNIEPKIFLSIKIQTTGSSSAFKSNT